MNHRRLFLFYFPALFLFFLGGIFLLYSGEILFAKGSREVRAECERIVAALEFIQKRYVEELSLKELCISAVKGIESQLDAYSRFYSVQEKKEFDEETEGKFGGIGIRIDVIDQVLTIVQVVEGKAAQRAGLKAGDRIVSVNGEKFYPIKNVELRDEMIRKIKGSVGTEVLLGILGKGEESERQVALVREEVKIETVEGVRVVDSANRIGYVRISSFSEQTAEDFDKALKKLLEEGIQDLIMDLRFNSGGPLKQALEVADRFLSDGVILSTYGRHEGSRRVYRAHAKGSLPADLGLVILINESSASASEVVAGAMQDHKRALLVGARSFGKGVIQSVLPLNQEGSEILKITTAKYYTPSNRCIDRQRGTGGKDSSGEEREPGEFPEMREERDLPPPREKEEGTRREAAAGGLDPDFPMEMSAEMKHKLLRIWRDEGIPAEYQTFEKIFSGRKEDFRDPQLELAIAILRGEEIFLPLGGEKGGEK